MRHFNPCRIKRTIFALDVSGSINVTKQKMKRTSKRQYSKSTAGEKMGKNDPKVGHSFHKISVFIKTKHDAQIM